MAADTRQIVKDFSIMGSTLKPMGNRNASTLIGNLKGKQPLVLKRQPDNPADKNAILVMYGQFALGYVPRGLAATIAPLMDAGRRVICRKAPNALYGVCQLAYIPPETPAAEPAPEAQLLSVEEAEAIVNAETHGEPSAEHEGSPTEEVPHAEPTADPPEGA